jgi:hypothetical protein
MTLIKLRNILAVAVFHYIFLCEFLFGENMVMPLVDLLATYYGDEESI